MAEPVTPSDAPVVTGRAPGGRKAASRRGGAKAGRSPKAAEGGKGRAAGRRKPAGGPLPSQGAGPAPGATHAPAAPAADTDAELIDAMRRTRPELFARLLEAYVAHAPGTVDDVIGAVQQGNVEALKIASHSLKSSSANVGARRLSELARQLELLARSDDLSAATVLAEELAAEFASVRAAFDRELAGLRKTAAR
jgi:HPt (histidine-containing phosphotransfer) domain-containing protein